MGKHLRSLGVEAIYIHEVFDDARWTIPGVSKLVHATFPWCPVNGDRFAYTSEWLARPSGQLHVPLMIDSDSTEADLREECNIPRKATVIGRHGGYTTFDIPFVHQVVKRVTEVRSDIYFVFLNTEPFCEPHPRIIHLPGTADAKRKTKFINTCDAMLHAREQGETFGLAVGEFSVRNKPVLTWSESKQKAHLEYLGHKGLLYRDEWELERLLTRFEPDPEGDWDAYSKRFNPRSVMREFYSTFLS